MSEQQDVPSSEEPQIPNPYARRRSRRWHWLLAFAVLAGGTYYIMGNKAEPVAENVPPEMQVTPPPPVTEPPADQGAVMPPIEPERATASADPDPLADPLAPIESTDLNQPPPAPMPTEEAPPAMAEPEPDPTPIAAPEPPPAPKLALKKKRADAKKKTRSYKLVFSKNGTKVPSGLKKDKVLKFIAKKLDGDKSCLPKLEKKDVKPFVAIVNVSKTGAVTAVTTQPKMPESKKIAACIKKKLAGSPATFKGKGKASARISVALKMK